MKKSILTTIAIAFTIILTAQVNYEKRLEFDLKDGYSGEKILQFENTGFLMHSRKDDAVGGKFQWKYELYDTDLNSVKSKSISIDKKYRQDETFNTETRAFSLFKEKKGGYAIVSIEAATLKETKVEGVMPKKSWIKSMAVLGDYTFFNASIKGSPCLFSINWKTGAQKIIPVMFDGLGKSKIKIQNFQVLEASNEVFVYVKTLEGRRENDMYVIRLNEDGKKQDMFKLAQSEENNIVSVTASKVEDGRYIFTGTYSDRSTSASKGLFICRAKDSKVDFIKYHKFLDLKNFLTYLPEKRQEKIEKKKERKEEKGKELKYQYLIAGHDIVHAGDDYIYLGEAYYPTYRRESYTTTETVNGQTRTVTRYRTVFDGYRYTHAVIVKFDSQGNLKWDETFEMWPAYKPFHVKRFISIAEKNEHQLKLVFASRSKITSQTVGFDGKITKDFESEVIETQYEGDKHKGTFSNIDYWYGRYFLAYGSATIKNKENEKVDRKRKVFFISKVGY